MGPTDQLEILHVSDLHISTNDTFGRETVLGTLVGRGGVASWKGCAWIPGN